MIEPPQFSTAQRRDAGVALPMVMVLCTVIATSVLLLASYSVTNLRYATVTENRSDRLSAADAGMRYAIDQLKLRNAGCILDTQTAVLPGVQTDFNGASASVTCERVTSGFEGIQAYAAVMTGEGLTSSQWLLSSQSGSNAKILGGPVYMTRVTPAAFNLSPPVQIADGPLLYHDTTGNVPCQSVKNSAMPSNLVFKPDLIFGPVCVSVPWTELFDSPTVPNLTGLVTRNGVLPLVSSPALPAAQGSYTDVGSGASSCRVFEPGRYTSPPNTIDVDAYFKTGNYLFEFNAPWVVRKSNTVAGRINPLTTTSNELAMSSGCVTAQQNDPAGAGQFGATIYFAGGAHINIATQGSLEIHTRQQGTSDYVSVQTLCTPNATWCNADGGGSFPTPKASTLTAPATAVSPNFLFTDSGNNKEFVAHALVYAPRAQVEFGNVTNTATQKMLGGLIVSRLALQSSASATNFEISVPTSPITALIRLTSKAVKGGETSIQAVVEYRPYEPAITKRVRVNSWRVCPPTGCSTTPPSPVCTGGTPAWTNTFYSNPNLSGSPVFTESTATLSYNWGTGSPSPLVPNNGFSGRFSRVVDLPSAGTYRFTVGSDDGQRFKVNNVLRIDDWNLHPLTTNTVDVVIANRCNVSLELEYFENTGDAAAFVTWTKIGP